MAKTEPLYKLIYSTLRKQILTGVFPYKSRLPSEKDLSSQFQVSRITSKRALNELAKDGYIERFAGKGSFVSFKRLLKEQTFSLSLLLPFFKNAGLEEYIRGISDYLKPLPFELTIHTTQKNSQKQRELVQSLSKATCDGIILYPDFPETLLDLVYDLYLKDFPIVLLDKELFNLPIPVISSENLTGGYEATIHALEQGHRNILFFSLASFFENSAVKNRYLGYLKALHEYNVKPAVYLNELNESFNMNQQDMIESFLIQTKQQGYTCIFVEHDILALELISTASNIKWSIPEDMSFIGFDDVSLSHMITPKLTTIKQDFYRIGYTAAETLVSMITEPDKKEKFGSFEIPIKLTIRESVKLIKKSTS